MEITRFSKAPSDCITPSQSIALRSVCSLQTLSHESSKFPSLFWTLTPPLAGCLNPIVHGDFRLPSSEGLPMTIALMSIDLPVTQVSAAVLQLNLSRCSLC